MIRAFGPAHINLYGHAGCAEALQQKILSRGDVMDPAAGEVIPAKRLIGTYPDITHCDECGGIFQEGDEPYIKYKAISPDELALWQGVKREDEEGVSQNWFARWMRRLRG